MRPPARPEGLDWVRERTAHSRNRANGRGRYGSVFRNKPICVRARGHKVQNKAKTSGHAETGGEKRQVFGRFRRRNARNFYPETTVYAIVMIMKSSSAATSASARSWRYA